MFRVHKHLAAIATVLLVAGCAGGSNCGGTTPLPEGFKAESRIENAGSVRLTNSGIDFLEKNLGTMVDAVLGGSGGMLTFEVPNSTGKVGMPFGTTMTYELCPGGPDSNANPPKCVAEIDIGNATITVDTAAPHNIHIKGPLPLRLQNLPLKAQYGLGINTTVVLNGNDSCPPGNQTYANIDLDVDISIEIDNNQEHSRRGYSKVKVAKLGVNEGQLKNALHFCPDNFGSDILNGLKDIAFSALVDPLLNQLQGTLEQQLCQQANPELNPPCPTGTNDVGGVCRYGTKDTDECASIILGLDGHADLGQLLAGISPGTRGGLDFLFAAGGSSLRDDKSGFAWGDLNSIGGGATLGLYGGAEATPLSGCVPISNLPLPTGIPIPDELLADSVTDWPQGTEGPHIGVAVSERFANYALNNLYNSGMLCIGISTSTVDMLTSGTFGLVANSLKDLGIQQETQQIAITVRPQSPPQVTFGNGTDLATDPLVRVNMKQASFDFYMWSLDRFIRFMTVTFDLDVPLNLTVTPEGIQPVLNQINVSNGKVTNSALLLEDPEVLAATLQDLISSIVGQAVGGGLPSIDINSSLASLGLTLNIPESVEGKGSPGMRKLTKGTDSYLGIFAGLGFQAVPPAPPGPLPAGPASPAHTESSAQIIRKEIDPAGVRLPTMNPANAPLVRLQMTSTLDDGATPIEYAYRVDNGFWRPFTRERIVDINDPWIRLQGRHTVHVRSRIAGEAMSLDPTPATVEVLVDVDPPKVVVGPVVDESATLTVKDTVSSNDSQVMVRTRLDDSAWSEWKPAGLVKTVLVGDAHEITVEARDEEGNVAESTQALIRGGVADAASACGCVVVGADQSTAKFPWLLGAALAAIALRLGRRGRATGGGSKGRPAAAPAKILAGEHRRQGGRRTLAPFASAAAILIGGSFAGCNCGEDAELTGDTYTCDAQTGCTTLQPGLIGAYTSAAVTGSTIWVAGYAEGDWNNAYSYGDLAVGRWSKDHVEWGLVDGVPREPPTDVAHYNKLGFRGGQTEPGDDVGIWTSTAIDANDRPIVAYYDRTNRALKFAQFNGTSWSVSTVQQKPSSDIGRYAKLLVMGERPVIAYLAIEPGGEGGALLSSVRVATATSPAPGESDWTFEDAVVNTQTPCRAAFCGSETACLASTQRCADVLPNDQCPEKCGSGRACVSNNGTPACVDVLGNNVLDSYPVAVGDYVSIAPLPKGGIGIAYYDRIHGNLAIASKATGSWVSQVIDGESNGVDTGDVGIGASLAIDGAGDWHIAYADGYSEGLRYVRVAQGTSAGAFEVVDDGLGVEGDKFADGQHVIGDDANIFVNASGEVHISYQDATAGTLHYAKGSLSGDTHTWQVRVIEQKDRFAGAFSRLLMADGKLLIANWWRVGGATEVGVKGDVAILSP